jgi:hypothetical protein
MRTHIVLLCLLVAACETARPAVGRALVYDLELEEESSFDPVAVLGGESPDGPARSQLGVRGRLIVTTVAQDRDGTIRRWRMEEATIDDAAVARALTDGFEVLTGDDGAVRAVRWPADAPAAARNLFLHLPARLPLARPAGRGRRDEPDAVGRLTVEYRARRAAGKWHITRTPVAVSQLAVRTSGAARRAGLAGRPGGALELVFDPARGVVERVEGALSLTIVSRVEGREVARLTDRVRARLLAVGHEAPPSPLLGPWHPLGEPLPVDLDREREERERRLAGVDTAALVAGWAGLGPDGIDRLRAHLALHPGAVHDLILELRRLGNGHPRLELGLSLVAGAPPGQPALRALADDWPEATDVVLAALGRAAPPEPATLALLEARLAGAGARRGLGRALLTLREHDPDGARRLGERLAARLADADHRWLVILLGNGGAPELLPHARRVLAGDDAKAREDVLLALRFVHDPEADQLLAGSLREERDPAALLAALTALRYRVPTPPTGAALRARLAGELPDEARGLAAQLLAREES